MLTSSGRYYRKVQFDRLVEMVEEEYKQKGVVPRRERIIKELLEKTATQFMAKKEEKEQGSLVSTKSERQSHFEKTYKKQ